MTQLAQDVTTDDGSVHTTLDEGTMIVAPGKGKTVTAAESAMHSGMRLTSTSGAELASVDLTDVHRGRIGGRVATWVRRCVTKAPTTVGSKADAGEHGDDRTMAVVSGWFFPPPCG